MSGGLRFERGGLDDPRVVALVATHLAHCRAETAELSAHGLDIDDLKSADVSFWCSFEGERLVGVGAWKRLGDGSGEIKSMHVDASGRRAGAGAAMLAHLVAEAGANGVDRLFLETGSWDYFFPARQMYRRHGFHDTTPFAGYRSDPHSLFMTRALRPEAAPALETRDATEADLPAILALYNRIVATSTAIYRDDPTTLEERADWFAARRAAGFPVIVAERAGETLGFASYGEWRGAFPGYRKTVEHSVHIAEGARGSGAGGALMRHLIDLARAGDFHVMLGAVDADNAASLAFHDKLGFARVSHFREVGLKFGRWLDLVFVQKTFG